MRSCKKKNLVHWRCSSSVSKNCRARITIDSKTEEVTVKGERVHKPPQFYNMSNGRYVRVHKN